MLFRLSNAQKKQLLTNAAPLTIALPTPAEHPADWLQWAKSALAEDGIYVSKVSQVSLSVGPPSGDGLTGIIGRIVQKDDSFADGLTWRVDAVLCSLNPPTAPRKPASRIQWPGFAEHNGKRWPKADATAGSSVGNDHE